MTSQFPSAFPEGSRICIWDPFVWSPDSTIGSSPPGSLMALELPPAGLTLQVKRSLGTDAVISSRDCPPPRQRGTRGIPSPHPRLSAPHNLEGQVGARAQRDRAEAADPRLAGLGVAFATSFPGREVAPCQGIRQVQAPWGL